MSKRETIILALTAVIIVYALLDYFVISGSPKNSEEKKISAAMAQTDAYATQTRTKLSTLSLNNTVSDMDHLIAQAQANWPSDPFITYKDTDSTRIDQEQEVPVDETALFYTGFIKAGNKVLAVINNMEYTIGELLKDVGYKVAKISPSRVVLLTGANKEISLQIKEN